MQAATLCYNECYNEWLTVWFSQVDPSVHSSHLASFHGLLIMCRDVDSTRLEKRQA